MGYCETRLSVVIHRIIILYLINPNRSSILLIIILLNKVLMVIVVKNGTSVSLEYYAISEGSSLLYLPKEYTCSECSLFTLLYYTFHMMYFLLSSPSICNIVDEWLTQLSVKSLTLRIFIYCIILNRLEKIIQLNGILNLKW